MALPGVCRGGPYCGCVMFAGMKAVRYTAASHTVDASGVARVKSTAARQGNAAATSGMTGSFQGVAVVQDGDAV